MVERAKTDKEWLRRVKKSLSSLYYGGAPTPLSVKKEAALLLGPHISLQQVYAQTEIMEITLLDGPEHHAEPNPEQSLRMDSTGKVTRPGCVRIVDGDNKTCEVGQYGYIEVFANPRFCVTGYFGAPEKTAQLFSDDGFIRTGDMGYLDKDNYLFICGRDKDMIVTEMGYNVFASDVETVLAKLPQVRDVAVTGVRPNGDEGFEYVCAFVVLSESISASDLFEYCKANLASAKVPSFIRFVDDLPRNRNSAHQSEN